MHRFLLTAVLILPPAQAREVDQGLAALRERLHGHPVAQRKLSGAQHRAAVVSGTLAETAAELEGAEGQDLAYLRERLLTAGRSLDADFASIEAKLAGLGLPEKTAAWQEFVRHYRTRLAEVEKELAALASGGLSSEALRTRLAALRAARLGTIAALRAAAQRAPQRLNLYAYAANNPLLRRDPSGLWTEFDEQFPNYPEESAPPDDEGYAFDPKSPGACEIPDPWTDLPNEP